MNSLQLMLSGYLAVLQLTECQVEALRNGDVDLFCQLQDERDARFAGMPVASPATAGSEQEADQSSVAALRQALRSLVAIDTSLARMLMAEMEATRGEVDRLRKGRRALTGYGGQTGRRPAAMVDAAG